MPLPHFLLMILAVIAAAGLTLWLAAGLELPALVLGLAALTGAALMRLVSARNPHG